MSIDFSLATINFTRVYALHRAGYCGSAWRWQHSELRRLPFQCFQTLVAALLVGWVLLISGALTFFGSFSIHGTGPFFGALLLSLLSLAAGVFLLFNPLAGAVALLSWSA